MTGSSVRSEALVSRPPGDAGQATVAVLGRSVLELKATVTVVILPQMLFIALSGLSLLPRRPPYHAVNEALQNPAGGDPLDCGPKQTAGTSPASNLVLGVGLLLAPHL